MNLFTFYRLSVFSSILFILLAIILMFAPTQMLASWGVELTTSVGLMARRISALYIGIAAMFFFARNAEHSATRTALIYGTIISCLILAALGAYELSVGHASSGILPAVFVEIGLALAFTYVGCACNNINSLNKNQRKK
ncbi:MAG: hypothetical protein CTY35_15195 [Methylotenera sp.]|jgi:hypothetical protein|uniref:hypothetical protein n=2 Tax=Methylotenera sp. TaxID=2051956 RepID=UPI000D42C54B|nr:hypothetical protein [Methylotenera sp.]MDP3211175.1 hypothetical protein [Methylotenera sp.]MDP3777998.1 hypothetical protein [Methylotenera sp.]PPC89464.1 MAG: hypothetical protein CTY35_15195 [Methylotenera sp.]